jgi:subtilisin family serine protease
VTQRAAVRRAALRAVLGAALLLFAGCATTPSATPEVHSVAREVLLTVPHANTAIGLSGPPDSRHLRRRRYAAAPPEVERVLDDLAAKHGIERKQGWPIRSLAAYCEVFIVPEDRDVAEVLDSLRADPRVDLVQRMNLFESLGSGYDDPYADLQPAALELGVEQAHRLATGKGVRVAIIDSAVDAAHPEFAGRIDLARDFVDPGGRQARAEVHGTAVAGVIASAGNNQQGIFGIAPDVGIASLRACWTHPDDAGGALCSSFTLAQALEVAIVLRPDVINLSLAGPPDALLERLLDQVAERGIVIVAAAPPAPAGAGSKPFPSSHPAVLVARSSTAIGTTTQGLPAPADEILTTIPGGYAIFSGTSLAAAHLSGIVALLRERAPSLAADRIADVLRRTLVWQHDRATVNACYALEALADATVCDPRVETAAR